MWFDIRNQERADAKAGKARGQGYPTNGCLGTSLSILFPEVLELAQLGLLDNLSEIFIPMTPGNLPSTWLAGKAATQLTGGVVERKGKKNTCPGHALCHFLHIGGAVSPERMGVPFFPLRMQSIATT